MVTSHNIHHSRRLVKAPVFPPAGPESWSLMTTIRENPFVTSRVARGPPSPSPRVDDPTPWMTLVTALRWQPRTRCAAAVPRRCPRRAAPPPLLRELRPTADLKWPAGRLINTRLPSTRRSCTTPKLRFTRSVVHFFSSLPLDLPISQRLPSKLASGLVNSKCFEGLDIYQFSLYIPRASVKNSSSDSHCDRWFF